MSEHHTTSSTRRFFRHLATGLAILGIAATTGVLGAPAAHAVTHYHGETGYITGVASYTEWYSYIVTGGRIGYCVDPGVFPSNPMTQTPTVVPGGTVTVGSQTLPDADAMIAWILAVHGDTTNDAEAASISQLVRDRKHHYTGQVPTASGTLPVSFTPQKGLYTHPSILAGWRQEANDYAGGVKTARMTVTVNDTNDGAGNQVDGTATWGLHRVLGANESWVPGFPATITITSGNATFTDGSVTWKGNTRSTAITKNLKLTKTLTASEHVDLAIQVRAVPENEYYTYPDGQDMFSYGRTTTLKNSDSDVGGTPSWGFTLRSQSAQGLDGVDVAKGSRFNRQLQDPATGAMSDYTLFHDFVVADVTAGTWPLADEDDPASFRKFQADGELFYSPTNLGTPGGYGTNPAGSVQVDWASRKVVRGPGVFPGDQSLSYNLVKDPVPGYYSLRWCTKYGAQTPVAQDNFPTPDGGVTHPDVCDTFWNSTEVFVNPTRLELSTQVVNEFAAKGTAPADLLTIAPAPGDSFIPLPDGSAATVVVKGQLYGPSPRPYIPSDAPPVGTAAAGGVHTVNVTLPTSGTGPVSVPYTAGFTLSGSGYYTWVWHVELGDQSPAVQRILYGSFGHKFGLAAETHMAPLGLELSSQVADRYVAKGTAPTDRVTVTLAAEDQWVSKWDYSPIAATFEGTYYGLASGRYTRSGQVPPGTPVIGTATYTTALPTGQAAEPRSFTFEVTPTWRVEHSGYGVWVWKLVKANQPSSERAYFDRDASHEFGLETETAVTGLDVVLDSQVEQRHITKGGRPVDTVTISPAPGDQWLTRWDGSPMTLTLVGDYYAGSNARWPQTGKAPAGAAIVGSAQFTVQLPTSGTTPVTRTITPGFTVPYSTYGTWQWRMIVADQTASDQPYLHEDAWHDFAEPSETNVWRMDLTLDSHQVDQYQDRGGRPTDVVTIGLAGDSDLWVERWAGGPVPLTLSGTYWGFSPSSFTPGGQPDLARADLIREVTWTVNLPTTGGQATGYVYVPAFAVPTSMYGVWQWQILRSAQAPEVQDLLNPGLPVISHDWGLDTETGLFKMRLAPRSQAGILGTDGQCQPARRTTEADIGRTVTLCDLVWLEHQDTPAGQNNLWLNYWGTNDPVRVHVTGNLWRSDTITTDPLAVDQIDPDLVDRINDSEYDLVFTAAGADHAQIVTHGLKGDRRGDTDFGVGDYGFYGFQFGIDADRQEPDTGLYVDDTGLGQQSRLWETNETVDVLKRLRVQTKVTSWTVTNDDQEGLDAEIQVFLMDEVWARAFPAGSGEYPWDHAGAVEHGDWPGHGPWAGDTPDMTVSLWKIDAGRPVTTGSCQPGVQGTELVTTRTIPARNTWDDSVKVSGARFRALDPAAQYTFTVAFSGDDRAAAYESVCGEQSETYLPSALEFTTQLVEATGDAVADSTPARAQTQTRGLAAPPGGTVRDVLHVTGSDPGRVPVLLTGLRARWEVFFNPATPATDPSAGSREVADVFPVSESVTGRVVYTNATCIAETLIGSTDAQAITTAGKVVSADIDLPGRAGLVLVQEVVETLTPLPATGTVDGTPVDSDRDGHADAYWRELHRGQCGLVAEAAEISPVPEVGIEKWDTAEGWAQGSLGDHDTPETPARPPVGAPTPISFEVVNTGTEPLVDLAVSDATTSGPAQIEGLSCDFTEATDPARVAATTGTTGLDLDRWVAWTPPGGTPQDPTPTTGTRWNGPLVVGASFTCTGTLPGLPAGASHSDLATVTGTGLVSGLRGGDEDPWHAATPTAGFATQLLEPGDTQWADPTAATSARRAIDVTPGAALVDVLWVETAPGANLDGWEVTWEAFANPTTNGPAPAPVRDPAGPGGIYPDAACTPATLVWQSAEPVPLAGTGQYVSASFTAPASAGMVYIQEVVTAPDGTGGRVEVHRGTCGLAGESATVTATPTPRVSIEKYTQSEGPVQGDHDTQGEAQTLPPDQPTVIGFTVTNTGTEPLVEIEVSDTTIHGGATLTGLACDFPTASPVATPVAGGSGSATRPVAVLAAATLLVPTASGTRWAGPLEPGGSFDCHATLDPVTGLHGDRATVAAKGHTSGITVEDTDEWWGQPSEPGPGPTPEPVPGEHPKTGTDPAGNLALAAGLAGAGGLLLTWRRRLNR